MLDFIRLTLTSLLLVLCSSQLSAQSDSTASGESRKFFIGIAVGTSFAQGNFGDTDISNADAGYAENGNRYDLYSGYFLSEHVTLTAGMRYQRFSTDLSDVVDLFNEIEPDVTFVGENGDWQTYYILLGAAYKIPLVRRFALYPRLGLGPLWAVSPGLEVQATDGGSQNSFFRSTQTGFGVGYELGVGLRTNLGKRFALLPTFTFSGGWANLKDVETRLNNISVVRDFEARIQSFNIGLSLAVRL